MCSSTLLINKTPAVRFRFARVGPHLSAKSQSQEIPLDRGPLAVMVRTASEAGWEENDCPSIFAPSFHISLASLPNLNSL